jgi:predicted O-methyltransferase YrrM
MQTADCSRAIRSDNTLNESDQRDPPFRSKMAMLSKLALASPGEAAQRIANIVESHFDALRGGEPSYEPVILEKCLESVSQLLGWPIMEHLGAESVGCLEEAIDQRIGRLKEHGPFRLTHIATRSLGRLCYILCRAVKPEVAIETGTAYGLTSAYILQALEDNGKGRLISIDLPPLGNDADRYVGILVPDALRERWQLVRGTSRQHLERVLRGVGRVDMFVHDSLHTHRTMMAEFLTIVRFMHRPGVIVADDIHENTAFSSFVTRVKPSYAAAILQSKQKRMTGLALFVAARADQ